MKNNITKDIEYMKYVLGYKRGVVISEQQHINDCIKGNCENGKGTMKYANESVYTGQWKDGAKNGQGTYKNINGKTFSGNWVDGELDGKDMSMLDEIKPSNAQYYGCLRGDCENGSGAYKYPDGSVYTGQWKDGEKNGQGTYKYPDGDAYTGQWKDGEKNGKGTYKYPDGAAYTGQYKEGEKNGQGTYTNINGVISSGNWVDGKLKGKSFYDLDKIKPSNNATKPNNAQSNLNCVQPTEPTHRFKNDRNYQYAKSGECWWAKNIINNKWFNLTELVKTKPNFQSSIDRLNDGTDLIKL